MAFKNFYLNIPEPKDRGALVRTFNPKPILQILHGTKSEETRLKYQHTPRVFPLVRSILLTDPSKFIGTSNYPYNPFYYTVSTGKVNLYDVKGMVTELGAPIVGKRILVVLMTTDGVVVEKNYTDLEGNFIFYDIPENMNLMAVAVDATYKYNAVILSKIMTVDNGE